MQAEGRLAGDGLFGGDGSVGVHAGASAEDGGLKIVFGVRGDDGAVAAEVDHVGGVASGGCRGVDEVFEGEGAGGAVGDEALDGFHVGEQVAGLERGDDGSLLAGASKARDVGFVDELGVLDAQGEAGFFAELFFDGLVGVEQGADRAVADGVSGDVEALVVGAAHVHLDLLGRVVGDAGGVRGDGVGEGSEHPGGAAVEGAVNEELEAGEADGGARVLAHGVTENLLDALELVGGGVELDGETVEFASIVHFEEEFGELGRGLHVVDFAEAASAEVVDGEFELLGALGAGVFGLGGVHGVAGGFQQDAGGNALLVTDDDTGGRVDG